MRKPADWSLMPTIIQLVVQVENNLCGLGIHDNLYCQGLWLKLHPDGSGELMQDYTNAEPDESKEMRLLRTVFTLNSMQLLSFTSLEELHGELVAMTMRTVQGTDDAAPQAP